MNDQEEKNDEFYSLMYGTDDSNNENQDSDELESNNEKQLAVSVLTNGDYHLIESEGTKIMVPTATAHSKLLKENKRLRLAVSRVDNNVKRLASLINKLAKDNRELELQLATKIDKYDRD